MSFDSNDFYRRLDEKYLSCDNEQIEQFLLTSLENIENAAMVEGRCCGRFGQGGGVDEQAERQAELEWEISRAHGSIIVRNELACFYRGVSRWDECLAAFESVKAAMEEASLSETDNYAVVLVNMAGALYQLGQREKAIAYYERAEQVLLKNGGADPYVMGSLYNGLGLVYQAEGQFSSAAEYFGKALTYTARIDQSDEQLATGLSNVALSYFSDGAYDKADEAIDKALAIFETLDDGVNPNYAGGLNTKAFICYHRGELEQAAAYFKQAADKTEKIFGQNADYVKICRNAAVVYDKLGQGDFAAAYNVLAYAAEQRLKGLS